MEYRIKLKDIRCICLTALCPAYASGVPGIILALSDLGVGNITIIGPPGLQGLISNMHCFTNRR